MADDPYAYLRGLTAARIGLGRTGVSLPTRRVLEFQLAHAEARDAIHAPLDVGKAAADLADLQPIVVESLAADRRAYLERPDEGRRLSDASRARLAGRYDCALVLGDGLSARAAQEHGPALVRALRAATPGWRWSPPVIATLARVALGDEIAAALGADLVVMLIGERPGLSSPDSLGAYLTFAPKPGMTHDAQRNCVSNIRPQGLPIAEAVRKIAAIAALARRLKQTGVALKEDDALAVLSREAGAIEE
ncbi:MAG TPA: ethanolamine ammonia-lyase subunit EutC [Rhodoblastus sp.]|nr:ethanolamine ammonia-lyase subunit EutC [Rhodoblastus sp.]